MYKNIEIVANFVQLVQILVTRREINFKAINKTGGLNYIWFRETTQ